MTHKKRPHRAATEGMADGLNGLLESLSDALNDMMTRLDDGTADNLERHHTFETPNGPVRAQAGVRVRMGGLDAASRGKATPQPINPNRGAQPPAPPKEREVACDVIESEDHWTVTADLPGIAEDEVTVTLDGTMLQITAQGRRHYRATCDLGGPAVLPDNAITLHNGILTLTVRKAAQA